MAQNSTTYKYRPTNVTAQALEHTLKDSGDIHRELSQVLMLPTGGTTSGSFKMIEINSLQTLVKRLELHTEDLRLIGADGPSRVIDRFAKIEHDKKAEERRQKRIINGENPDDEEKEEETDDAVWSWAAGQWKEDLPKADDKPRHGTGINVPFKTNKDVKPLKKIALLQSEGKMFATLFAHFEHNVALCLSFYRCMLTRVQYLDTSVAPFLAIYRATVGGQHAGFGNKGIPFPSVVEVRSYFNIRRFALTVGIDLSSDVDGDDENDCHAVHDEEAEEEITVEALVRRLREKEERGSVTFSSTDGRGAAEAGSIHSISKDEPTSTSVSRKYKGLRAIPHQQGGGFLPTFRESMRKSGNRPVATLAGSLAFESSVKKPSHLSNEGVFRLLASFAAAESQLDLLNETFSALPVHLSKYSGTFSSLTSVVHTHADKSAPHFWTPLAMACARKNMPLVKLLVSLGHLASAFEEDENGSVPLLAACAAGVGKGGVALESMHPFVAAVSHTKDDFAIPTYLLSTGIVPRGKLCEDYTCNVINPAKLKFLIESAGFDIDGFPSGRAGLESVPDDAKGARMLSKALTAYFAAADREGEREHSKDSKGSEISQQPAREEEKEEARMDTEILAAAEEMINFILAQKPKINLNLDMSKFSSSVTSYTAVHPPLIEAIYFSPLSVRAPSQAGDDHTAWAYSSNGPAPLMTKTEIEMMAQRRERFIKLLLKHGADPNFVPEKIATTWSGVSALSSDYEPGPNPGRISPMHAAVCTYSTDLVDLLLTAGGTVNIYNQPDKITPLHLILNGNTTSAAKVREEMVLHLIDRGASVCCQDHKGKPPLLRLTPFVWRTGEEEEEGEGEKEKEEEEEGSAGRGEANGEKKKETTKKKKKGPSILYRLLTHEKVVSQIKKDPVGSLTFAGDGRTALWWANSLPLFDHLLSLGVDPSSQSNTHATVLHSFCRGSPSTEGIEFGGSGGMRSSGPGMRKLKEIDLLLLVERYLSLPGVNIDCRQDDSQGGQTPLHCALFEDPREVGASSFHPTTTTARGSKLTIAHLLIQRGCRLDIPDAAGNVNGEIAKWHEELKPLLKRAMKKQQQQQQEKSEGQTEPET